MVGVNFVGHTHYGVREMGKIILQRDIDTDRDRQRDTERHTQRQGQREAETERDRQREKVGKEERE